MRTWTLTGGVSAQVSALELEYADSERQKLVLRQVPAGQSAEQEFRLMQLLASLGVPVPKVYHCDESGVFLPQAYFFLDYVEGETRFQPIDVSACLAEMVNKLIQIHQVPLADFDFLPLQNERLKQRLQIPSQSINEETLRASLELRFHGMSALNPRVLLHGDYWQGNLLWQGTEIKAILDWESAALGDPLANVANTRLEVYWAWGESAMLDFTAFYRAQMPDLDYRSLAYWDLYTALRRLLQINSWGLSEAKVHEMRHTLENFITFGLRQL